MKFSKNYIIKNISYVTPSTYGDDYTDIIFFDGILKCKNIINIDSIYELRDCIIEDMVKAVNKFYDENKDNGHLEIYKRNQKIKKIEKIIKNK